MHFPVIKSMQLCRFKPACLNFALLMSPEGQILMKNTPVSQTLLWSMNLYVITQMAEWLRFCTQDAMYTCPCGFKFNVLSLLLNLNQIVFQPVGLELDLSFDRWTFWPLPTWWVQSLLKVKQFYVDKNNQLGPSWYIMYSPFFALCCWGSWLADPGESANFSEAKYNDFLLRPSFC